MMFVEDLGELAYGIGEAVILSKEVVVVVAAEGDAADLPKSCDTVAEEACNKEFWAGMPMVFAESCGCGCAVVGSLAMTTGSAPSHFMYLLTFGPII